MPIIHIRDEFDGSGAWPGRTPNIGPAWVKYAQSGGWVSDPVVAGGYIRSAPGISAMCHCGRTRSSNLKISYQCQFLGQSGRFDIASNMAVTSDSDNQYRLDFGMNGPDFLDGVVTRIFAGANTFNLISSFPRGDPAHIWTVEWLIMNGRHQVRLDGVLHLDFTDPSPLPSGFIAVLAQGFSVSDDRMHRFEVQEFVNPIRCVV